jgi:hypothetical protein
VGDGRPAERTPNCVGRDPSPERRNQPRSLEIIISEVELARPPRQDSQIILHHVVTIAHGDHARASLERSEDRQTNAAIWEHETRDVGAAD